MAASGGILAPIALGILRKAVKDASKILRKKVSAVSQQISTSGSATQNVAVAPARASGARGQPVHPAAVFRQQRRLFSRWHAGSQNASYSTSARRFLNYLADAASGKTKPRFDRSKLPTSKTARAVSQFSGRAPFAHTLRPNLTGGALPRSAGGYGLGGGGARYFSHTPTAPAQVVQNVSQAMRAFMLSGQRARFDGLDNQGRKKYRSVSALEDETARKMASIPRFVPGSFIDFRLSPTITAMSPLAATTFPFPTMTNEEPETDFVPTPYTQATNLHRKALHARSAPTCLNTDGFLDELSLDISRALKDLKATMADIKRLATLGDLIVELLPPSGKSVPTLRVRFPGVDAATVEALADDLGITRGLVGQDRDFDASAGVPVALKFPFAPTAHSAAAVEDVVFAKTITSPGGSLRSLEGHELEEEEEYDALGWSLSEGEEAFILDEFSENPWVSDPETGERECSDGFEGIEGIYRFIEECDRAKGQFRGTRA